MGTENCTVLQFDCSPGRRLDFWIQQGCEAPPGCRPRHSASLLNIIPNSLSRNTITSYLLLSQYFHHRSSSNKKETKEEGGKKSIAKRIDEVNPQYSCFFFFLFGEGFQILFLLSAVKFHNNSPMY